MRQQSDAREAMNSHERYRGRYFVEERAQRYAKKQKGSRTHVREIRCIAKALGDAAARYHILDIPCGAGRLLPDLAGLAARLTAADVAPPMVAEARRYAESKGVVEVDYRVADVLRTGLDDDSVDIVVCNRMFHHFTESEIRVAVLRELARISRRMLVISFFCSYSLDAALFHLGNFLRKNKSDDRLPISYRRIRSEAEAAGLRVTGIYPTRPGISRQWYLRLEPGTA